MPNDRGNYQSDDDYICGGYDDADLAAHIAVTYHRGIAVYGKAIREVFQPIDELFYIKSILYDVQNAATDIIETPMYISLNLCRVLFFLREGAVSLAAFTTVFQKLLSEMPFFSIMHLCEPLGCVPSPFPSPDIP